MSNHVIVYSHGFGVRKDDRGLFTDIASSMPDAEHIMFNYNLIDEANNSLTASPLQDQVKILKEQLAKIDPGKTIDIVAHSQGCLVAALANPKNVRKIIFIAPPHNAGAERLIKYFSDYNGKPIDPDTESRVKRRDGSTTIIPAAYWQSLRGLNVMGLYNALAEYSKVTIIIAKQDEVLGATDFSTADKRIKLVKIDGNHDFNGEHRQNLAKIVKTELQED